MPIDLERRFLASALSNALRVPGDAPFLLYRAYPAHDDINGGGGGGGTGSDPATPTDAVPPYIPITYAEVADACLLYTSPSPRDRG